MSNGYAALRRASRIVAILHHSSTEDRVIGVLSASASMAAPSDAWHLKAARNRAAASGRRRLRRAIDARRRTWLRSKILLVRASGAMGSAMPHDACRSRSTALGSSETSRPETRTKVRRRRRRDVPSSIWRMFTNCPSEGVRGPPMVTPRWRAAARTDRRSGCSLTHR